MKENELYKLFDSCCGTITVKNDEEGNTYHLTTFGRTLLIHQLEKLIETKEREAFDAGKMKQDYEPFVSDGNEDKYLTFEDYKNGRNNNNK